MSAPSASVDGDRLWQRLMQLATFGGTADGGVNRQALSAEESPARAQLIAWGRAIGLTPFTDRAANLFLRLDGTDNALPPVVAGSHIDSQPTGGKFDGAFGVLAALEAVTAIVAAGNTPRRPIEIVAWTNEEGSRFAPGMTGSCLFVSQLQLDIAEQTKDAAGICFGKARDMILAGDSDVAERPFNRQLAAYIEPHIEQASVLERAGLPVGIVTGIQGTRRYRLTVNGQAGHAGTTPRAERRDALLAAARIVTALDDAASQIDDFKFTVGMFNVTPNAPSVVPQQVLFSVDIRHPYNDIVDAFDETIGALAEQHKGPCSVTVSQITHAPSVQFPKQMASLLQSHAESLGIPTMPVYSAAGHDSRQLSYVCPTGMLFVPCRDGVSHAPSEWAEPAHLTAATQILADALLDLASN